MRFLAYTLVFILAVGSCNIDVGREHQVKGDKSRPAEASAQTGPSLRAQLDKTPDWIPQALPAPAAPTRYILRAAFQEQPAQITGSETIIYTNNTEDVLDRLYLRLFPNSDIYKWDVGPGGEANTGKRLTPPGAAEVWDLTVDGKSVPLAEVDPTILEITLPRALAPGDQVQLNMNFTTSIPRTSTLGRLSFTGEAVELGYWYPLVAVLDRSGWHLDPMLPIGDSVYTEVADFDVNFDLPDGWIGVATGSTVTMTGKDNNVKVSRVRDFTVFLAKSWDNAFVGEMGDTKILVVAPPGFSKVNETLDVTVDALTVFNRLFGKYPYDSLVVIGGVGGIEGPGVAASISGGDRVLIHTIAHQWWYAAVGNDKVRSIWDEGLATYSESLYHEFGRFPITPLNFTKFGQINECLNRTLYSFLNDNPRALDDYLRVQYAGGALWFADLRARLGDKQFFELLHSFYTTHKFGIATWEDWRATIRGEFPELENAILCTGK
jgi:hypothetical protein